MALCGVSLLVLVLALLPPALAVSARDAFCEASSLAATRPLNGAADMFTPFQSAASSKVTHRSCFSTTVVSSAVLPSGHHLAMSSLEMAKMIAWTVAINKSGAMCHAMSTPVFHFSSTEEVETFRRSVTEATVHRLKQRSTLVPHEIPRFVVLTYKTSCTPCLKAAQVFDRLAVVMQGARDCGALLFFATAPLHSSAMLPVVPDVSVYEGKMLQLLPLLFKYLPHRYNVVDLVKIVLSSESGLPVNATLALELASAEEPAADSAEEDLLGLDGVLSENWYAVWVRLCHCATLLIVLIKFASWRRSRAASASARPTFFTVPQRT